MIPATVLFCGLALAPDAAVVEVVNVVPESLERWRRPLLQLRHLRRLEATGTPVSASAVAARRAAIPGVEIVGAPHGEIRGPR